MQGELKDSQESLGSAFSESKDANRNLEDAGKRITETKRKADDAHDQMRTHRDRCRRATKEFEMAEEDLNDSLGRVGQPIKDIARATHALWCGVPDRESNEAHYLEEALDMIEGEGPVGERQKSPWWNVSNKPNLLR